MIGRVLSAAACVVILSVLSVPAFANHDQGQGKSQDHLHRNQGVDGFAAVAAVPGPSSGAMLALGVSVAAAWLVFRRRQ